MKISLRLCGLLILVSFLFSACSDDPGNPQPPTADAGTYSPILPGNTSIILNGTGNTTNGHITGYLWSLISGPNLPEIMSPSSQATEVTNLVAGSYLFQFAVIDDAGLTGIDTARVNVSGSTSGGSLTLQPLNNPWEWEFYGNSTFNGSGHATQIDACAWTSSGEAVAVRGAVHFDLSGVPAGSTITSAKLSLFSTPDPQAGNLMTANFGTANAFYIRKISTAWTALGSTWQNQPSTTTTNQVLIPHTDAPMLNLIDVDVTSMIADMHNGNNYGMMFQLQNETYYNSRQFCSSIHADATKHPKLVVTYQ